MCCKRKKVALLWNENLSGTGALFIIFVLQGSWLTEFAWVNDYMKLRVIFHVKTTNCLSVLYEPYEAWIHVHNYVTLCFYCLYLFTLNNMLIHVAHETAISRNPPINNFTGYREKETWQTINSPVIEHVIFLPKCKEKQYFFFVDPTFW